MIATETKHTPGPWHVDTDCRDDTENMAYQLTDDAGTSREWVAVGLHDEDGYAASVAYCHPMNAPLIAAAPDLLAALSHLLGCAETDCMDDKSNVWRSYMIEARAAIAAATTR